MQSYEVTTTMMGGVGRGLRRPRGSNCSSSKRFVNRYDYLFDKWPIYLRVPVFRFVCQRRSSESKTD